jgi:hypothetical protein
MIPSEAAVLAVANALDHYAATRIQTGVAPFDAVDRSLAMISRQKSKLFSRSREHSSTGFHEPRR